MEVYHTKNIKSTTSFVISQIRVPVFSPDPIIYLRSYTLIKQVMLNKTVWKEEPPSDSGKGIVFFVSYRAS